ncbi:hypothetical protein PoB_001422700 [Plakobranchus ocellatus]|uniref:Uncharacterized protein n=1 Tax=Plakobranchus ocellatus TaxID=259542 RepID=A0AAV3YXL2_9GAST|nr:hypothetical protein PoB_001422700 [Plakobranchus ocellatus]
MKVAADLVSSRSKETRVLPNTYCWTREPLPPVWARPNAKELYSRNFHRSTHLICVDEGAEVVHLHGAFFLSGSKLAIGAWLGKVFKSVRAFRKIQDFKLHGDVAGSVASDSALRSAGSLLSRVRAPPPAPWPGGGSESLRSSCCGVAIPKTHSRYM